MFRNTDKTIVRTTVQMAWPSVVESFFVALAAIIDSFMVSSLGSGAVAAVGLTTQPKFIGLAIFMAINVSTAAITARRRGEQKKKEANELLLTVLLSVVVLSAVISVLFVTLADPIIRLCGSSPDTHQDAVTYYRVIMAGTFFNVVSMAINSAQRGAGNTRITMRTNLTSSAINILFNYLLINGRLGFPAWGVFGAAVATVLGTVAAAVMSFLSIMKKDQFLSLPYILREKLRPSLQAVRNIWKVGYSVLIEQLLLRIGFTLTAVMAANMGTYSMAAHQVGMNILSMSFSFGDGFQAAAVALIGRSLGERRPDMAKKYGDCCQKLGLIVSLVLAAAYILIRRPLYNAFFEEQEIVDLGCTIMYVLIVTVLFQVRQVIYMGSLRGAGDTGYTALACIINVTFVRTVVGYLCCYVLQLGLIGIWLGIFADQLGRFLMVAIRYRKGRWTSISI